MMKQGKINTLVQRIFLDTMKSLDKFAYDSNNWYAKKTGFPEVHSAKKNEQQARLVYVPEIEMVKFLDFVLESKLVLVEDAAREDNSNYSYLLRSGTKKDYVKYIHDALLKKFES